MDILWKEKSWLEYLFWQTQDKKTLKRINTLLKNIDRENLHCYNKRTDITV